MVFLRNICINTLHKGDNDDDDDDDDYDDNDDDDNNNNDDDNDNNNNNDNNNTQNIFNGRNNLSCSTNCQYRTAAKFNTPETRFVSGI